ncbi:hypothetical protein FIV38_03155 [Pseudomonas proteolytica]|nr:hypothetical protein F4W61_00610 [Pseudomonas proteolytica]TWR85520.1 hypothetical protein FIV38_03155 [Pseudomonas proteolytica]
MSASVALEGRTDKLGMCRKSVGGFVWAVGASLLAKTVNDNAGSQNARGGLRFFASKLAPAPLG